MKLVFPLFIFCLSLLSTTSAHAINPLSLPVWSDLDKYQSKSVQVVPYREQNYILSGGLNYGGKNGYGLDGTFCKKLSRYLCGGGRVFVGLLNSLGLVRTPTQTEAVTDPNNPIYPILAAPNATWFAFIPEVGLSVNSRILPLDALWSESAWFGFGKAFISGMGGWILSFEPGINKRFAANSALGWTFRAKYSFGWLNPAAGQTGVIPYDMFNITAGVFYVW